MPLHAQYCAPGILNNICNISKLPEMGLMIGFD